MANLDIFVVVCILTPEYRDLISTAWNQGENIQSKDIENQYWRKQDFIICLLQNWLDTNF